MVLLVLSKREEPNLVVKTIAAQFQSAKIRTVFMSQPDAVSLILRRRILLSVTNIYVRVQSLSCVYLHTIVRC